MKIYMSSAMFTEQEQNRVNKIARLLRAMGHQVYVPHEYKVPNADKMKNEEWAKNVFQHDIEALDEAEAVYYFCEGMNGDIGAAWECGYAYAKGKRIFVDELQEVAEISLMVAQCSETEIESYQS